MSSFAVRADRCAIGISHGTNRAEKSSALCGGVARILLATAVGKDTLVNLGVYNVTNSNADNYGRLGLGVYVPVNHFFTSVFPNSLSEGATAERFGLPPTSFAISVTQRVSRP
jgi:hypothetical protein